MSDGDMVSTYPDSSVNVVVENDRRLILVIRRSDNALASPGRAIDLDGL